MQEYKRATLLLDDGSRFEGYSFGYEASVAGEVVFTTAMTGYTESFTDPSYRGQILVMTYPLVGNYGVPSSERDAHGIALYRESDRIHPLGIVVSDYSEEHSHWNAEGSLAHWLCQEKVFGLTGIDTRELAKTLREKGSMLRRPQYAQPSSGSLPQGGHDLRQWSEESGARGLRSEEQHRAQPHSSRGHTLPGPMGL